MNQKQVHKEQRESRNMKVGVCATTSDTNTRL